MLNDFSVVNPTAGGELRINYLMKHLSNYRKVTMLCLNNDNRVSYHDITPNFRQISIPKTSEHLEEEWRINQQHWISRCRYNNFLYD